MSDPDPASPQGASTAAEAAVPRQIPRRVLVGLIVAVLAIFALRLLGQPLQPYGSNSAEYIEHTVRLELILLDRDWTGGLGSYLAAADGHIVTHPPGLHVITSALGGPSAGSVLWTGAAWLGLLALGLGLCGRALLPGTGWTAAAAALLFPAALGAATRYHYDLPMTALLWLGTGLMLTARGRLAWAPLAGLCFALACFVKWTALPFGLLMIAAAACVRSPGGRRVLPTLVTLAVAGSLVAFGLSLSSTSFAAGAMAVDSGERLGEGSAITNLALSLLDRIGAELGSPEPARLFWYLLAVPASLLGPIGLLVLLPLLAGWWRAGRPGMALVLGVTLAHVALLTLGLRVLDERFALTFVPALLLAGALGWASDSRAARWGPWVLAAGLLLHAEFHLGPAGPWNQPAELFADSEHAPPITFRGPFLGDSFEQRGWAARASTEAPRAPMRQALWEALRECGPPELGFVEGLDDHGDTWWLRYRSRLDSARGLPSEGLRVLQHGRLGELRYWWPDPDTEQQSHRYESLGFSMDAVTDELLTQEPSEAELAQALAAQGYRIEALRHFRPRLALSRIPPSPDGPLDDRWTLLRRIEADPWGEPLGLYALPGACP